MRVTKPTETQVLIEDPLLRGFKLEVESETGLVNSKFDNIYETLVLAYRFPGMDASKQIFYGDKLSLLTIFSSTFQNLIERDIMSVSDLEALISGVREVIGDKPTPKEDILRYIDRCLSTDKKLDLDAVLITIKTMLE